MVVDQNALLTDIQYLSSDELEGRKTGTEGAERAAVYIEQRFGDLGLNPFGDGYRQVFRFRNEQTGEFFPRAVNLVGYLEGSLHPDRFILVTAHYDHLGRTNGEVFNGADDNASGTAGMMEIARYFSSHPPENSLIFVAFDAEEQGLGGSRYFVDHPPVPLENQVVVINLDMISRNDRNEIYVAGTSHYDFLKPLIEESVNDALVDVRFGYDSPNAPDDWTLASDHGPFHVQGVPFVYFGVEDHEHYHHPDDIFEHIDRSFYVNVTEMILHFLIHLDRNLDQVVEASGRTVSGFSY